MRTVNVENDILPLSEFRTHMAEMVKELSGKRGPLILTQHGRSVAVVLSPREYEQLVYTEQFMAAVREGEAELDAGKGIPHEEVVAELKRRFELRAKARKGRAA